MNIYRLKHSMYFSVNSLNERWRLEKEWNKRKNYDCGLKRAYRCFVHSICMFDTDILIKNERKNHVQSTMNAVYGI